MTSNSMRVIADALIDGFDGLVLGDGSQLSADRKPDDIASVSDDVLPFLLFDVGNMQFEPWTAWEESISWDIPAILKVKGEAGEVDEILLDAIRDLLVQTKRLIGLPVDENGVVTPYGPTTQRLFEQDKLTFLAERGAPFIKAVRVQPSDGSYITAAITFHIESTFDLDPRGTLPIVQVATLGVNGTQGPGIAQDNTLPDPLGIAIVSASDQRSWGAYDSADPNTRRRPQMPFVQGSQQIVTGVNATPYTASLTSVLSTVQLSAIARYANWQTLYVTGQGGWASSDPTKATVSATGLVTWVAAGTTTITCTSNGVVSNGVVITCT